MKEVSNPPFPCLIQAGKLPEKKKKILPKWDFWFHNKFMRTHFTQDFNTTRGLHSALATSLLLLLIFVSLHLSQPGSQLNCLLLYNRNFLRTFLWLSLLTCKINSKEAFSW